MPKDIVVVTRVDAKPQPFEDLDILILSTAGEKSLKVYRQLEAAETDFPGLAPKVRTLFNQPFSLSGQQIGKVKIVGTTPPETPEALITALETLRQKDDDWYILLTDQTGDEFIKALGAWAQSTEPGESELAAGADDHRKLYFAQTNNAELAVTSSRTVIVYTDNLDEHADAAYLGSVGPFYPRSVNWKFKKPDGLTLPDLSCGARDALEEANINFLTAEEKHEYMKNGVCADGEFIDVVMGADYITRSISEEQYKIFLANGKIPYTNEGFALIGGSVCSALNKATSLGIISVDENSHMGRFSVSVPRRADATEEQARARRMPDIEWDAELESAIGRVRIGGVLRVNL